MAIFFAKLLLFVAWTVGVFMLGHASALHPAETRTFLERVRAFVSGLFQRDPKGGTK